MMSRSDIHGLFVRLGLLLMLVVTSLPLCAQEVCKARAMHVMEQMLQDLERAEGNRLYSKVVVTTENKDATERTSIETLELIAGDKRTAIVAPQLIMLEDPDARVVVLPMDRMVYVYDHVPTKKEPNETWWKYNEMAFRSGKLLSCKEAEGEHGPEIIVEFNVAEIMEMNGVEKIRFHVDQRRVKPISYRLQFGASSMLRERRFEYLAYEPGKADSRVTTGVLAQIMTNGKLIRSLSGYELKDLRTGEPRTIKSTFIPE